MGTRRRRTSDQARTAILDAAEARLREVGPGGIRLQEVARAVGVSHPTVLHHFGSREGLLDAVVKRALESVQAGLLEAVQAGAGGVQGIERLLARVAVQLKTDGRARTLLWLALAGYGPGLQLDYVRPLAQAVHEVRRQKRDGTARLPPFEDTLFSILLPTLALLPLVALEDQGPQDFDPARFRAWLARLVHQHLQGG